MTFRMKFAASRSVMLGLNLCLWGKGHIRAAALLMCTWSGVLWGHGSQPASRLWAPSQQLPTMGPAARAGWAGAWPRCALRNKGRRAHPLVAAETRAHLVHRSGCPRGHLARVAGPVSGTATPVSTQDILEELDCLATEAGQARVQHEGDQRDDSVHVGPGEGQEGR